MPKLTVQSGADSGKIHHLDGSRVVLGRSVSSDIQIVDRRMSRSHAEIFTRDGDFYVRDLGSKNGTLLNGAPITLPVILTTGDNLQVGDSILVFEGDTSHGGRRDESRSSQNKSSGSAYRLVDERQWGATQGEVRAGVQDATSLLVDIGGDALKDTHQRLEILYRVTEAIRSVFNIDELLEQIMEIIMEVVQPDRAYLLLRDEESDRLVPQVIKIHGEQEPVDMEVRVSTSIVERCMKDGLSLLVSDAAQDDRFSGQQSVIINRIRTAMVAPLLYKQDTLGVVYVDTQSRVVPFTREELELLTGISNQAAVAIQNARLHSQLIEQHKIAREMEIARTIQMNLLPKVYPELPGYEISAMSLPAKHVGGDYYDFMQLPDGRIALAIADVSGKGVPAAILTATTRSYLQSETQHPDSNIVSTVARINRMVHRDVTNDMYVTMALLYVQPETGEIDYVNAGHSHPLLMKPKGGRRFLDKGGLFLGILEETEYEAERITMEPGEVLVLATDGVADILDEHGRAFGTETFYQVVRDNITLSAEEIRNRIYQACLKHRGGADQFDDFTLIILKRRDMSDSFYEDLDVE